MLWENGKMCAHDDGFQSLKVSKIVDVIINDFFKERTNKFPRSGKFF